MSSVANDIYFLDPFVKFGAGQAEKLDENRENVVYLNCKDLRLYFPEDISQNILKKNF